MALPIYGARFWHYSSCSSSDFSLNHTTFMTKDRGLHEVTRPFPGVFFFVYVKPEQVLLTKWLFSSVVITKIKLVRYRKCYEQEINTFFFFFRNCRFTLQPRVYRMFVADQVSVSRKENLITQYPHPHCYKDSLFPSLFLVSLIILTCTNVIGLYQRTNKHNAKLSAL